MNSECGSGLRSSGSKPSISAALSGGIPVIMVTQRASAGKTIGTILTELKKMDERINEPLVIHSGRQLAHEGHTRNAEDVGNKWWANRAKERLKREFPIKRLWRLPTLGTVATHVGPGAWGIPWYIL